MTDHATKEAAPTPTTFTLTTKECLALLRSVDVGRIAVMQEGYPVAYPVNYVVARLGGDPVIAIRTRPANVIDRPDELVGFEIDGIDASGEGGWSVVVQGRLTFVFPHERFDSHPIVDEHRDAWRVIMPDRITGRRIISRHHPWPFDAAGYV